MPYYQGDHDYSAKLFADSATFYRNSGDYWFKANSIRMSGVNLGMLGQYKKSSVLLDESLAMARSRGDTLTIAWILYCSALIAFDRRKKRRRCEESLR